MSYTGLFLRQYMGQRSTEIPNVTDSWQFSPDLLVYGTTAAYDTSNFNSSDDSYESRNWYFSQAPAPGECNYVYVRGLTRGENIRSTIYLFYCDFDTLLQPKKWKSDNFSVAIDSGQPVTQNFFKITGISTNQLVVNYDAYINKGSLISWSPPAGDNPHYYLIAWINNTGLDSDNPPFDTLADFASITALGNYVKEHPNMLFLDTWFQGLFLRQFAGQTKTQPGKGAPISPDIIVTDTTAIQDPSTFSSSDSYASDKLNKIATCAMYNFIYIRGLNTNIIQQKARVYVFYANSDGNGNVITPPSAWGNDKFTVAGKSCNYVDIIANPGEIITHIQPIVWRVDPSTNYVLIAYVDNSETPKPPDFSIFGYVDPKGIAQFIATQPRLVCLEINSQAPEKIPEMMYEYPLSIKAGNNYVGLQFKNIPTTATVKFSMPGDAASNTLVKPSMQIPDPNAVVVWLQPFTKDLNTSLVLNYWSNNSLKNSDANIDVLIIPRQQGDN